MCVHYKILQYYPIYRFTLFHTIRLHCTYKYVRSLWIHSILSSTSVYFLSDCQTSLYIQICSFITKSFIPPHLFTLFQTIILHCTYKYVHSLRTPSLLSSTSFTLFQTIKLHCTYKYARSLQNHSILLSMYVYSLPE